MIKSKMTFLINQIVIAILLIAVMAPGRKQVTTNKGFLAVILLIDIYYIFIFLWKKEKQRAASDIMLLVWGFLILWEVMVTKLDRMHPVLFPAPENVFLVFFTQYQVLLENVISSMLLLLGGVAIGLFAGTISGLFCGWIPRLRGVFYPIASVLAPIPSLVYAPYIIALMPTFRSASALIVILGVFWPCFLNMIIRIESIDRHILDVTKIMKLSHFTMIFSILLPYGLPGIISGLKVTLTISIMMLTFAEMMGATRGMGYYIVNYNTYGNYTNVVAGIIVTGIVVTVLNKLVEWIQKKAIRWS